MKKQVIVLLLAALIGVGRLTAQEKDSMATLVPVIVTSHTVVTKEVDKAFKKAFPAAVNQQWYLLGKNYLAQFIQNDIKHQALFATKGFLKYVISYGTETHLPDGIRSKIKGDYEAYKITRVANVKEAGRNIWVTNLESLNHFVMVRAEDDKMEEVGKYNKSL